MRKPDKSLILENAAKLIADENNYFTRVDLREMTGISYRQIGIWLRHAIERSFVQCLNPGDNPDDRKYQYGFNDRIKNRTDEEVLAVGDRLKTWQGLGEIEPVTKFNRYTNSRYNTKHAQRTYLEICRHYDLYGKPMYGTTYGWGSGSV